MSAGRLQQMETNAVAAAPTRLSRHVSMSAVCLSTLLVFWPTLKVISSLAVRDDRYLQVILAPVVCLFLVYQKRARIFAKARYSPGVGFPLLVLAMLTGIAAEFAGRGGGGNSLPVAVSAIILAWIAAFVLCYGKESFRAALYPLSCLCLMIPLPPSWMDWIAAGLQHGSAAVSFRILRLSGIPVFRRGMVFSLPGLDFEVAPECSGIRSSLALMIVAVVVGYFYLRSGWARAVLILMTVPIALFKNAVRIVGISTLGAYVNRTFIDGPFHHQYGGPLFSIVGITLFFLVLAGLQKFDGQRPRRTASPS